MLLMVFVLVFWFEGMIGYGGYVFMKPDEVAKPAETFLLDYVTPGCVVCGVVFRYFRSCSLIMGWGDQQTFWDLVASKSIYNSNIYT